MYNTNIQKANNILSEIEGWNSGDQDTFNQRGEVPFDGNFVFVARQKKLNELKKILKSLDKATSI